MYNCNTVTMDIVELPVAPTSLVATAISSTQINLVWVDNATYETGYKIERKSGLSDTYVQIDIVAANATSYSDTTLSAATPYYYRVRAVTNGIGDSGYSNEANVATPVQTYNITGTITIGGSALAAVTVNLSGNATILQKLTETATEHLQAKSGYLLLLDKSGVNLNVKVCTGIDTLNTVQFKLAAGQGISGRVVIRRQADYRWRCFR